MDRIFTNPAATQAARDTVHPSNPPLTDTDIYRIRETWRRLGSLIPYHTGGFYIPGTLSSEARHLAYNVLQSREFGIGPRSKRHTHTHRLGTRLPRPSLVLCSSPTLPYTSSNPTRTTYMGTADISPKPHILSYER